MRVVDHHDGAVFFRQIAQPRQRPNVTIHGKHAVGDQQLLARLVFTLASCSSACATSLWRKTRIFAFDSRAPSMIDA
jgi:hypothetical protein